jgi:SAM-dependent methyltransferase
MDDWHSGHKQHYAVLAFITGRSHCVNTPGFRKPADWLSLWDRQQQVYLRNREYRFEALLDVVEALIGMERIRAEPLVVDLGCGPGSLSTRFLDRFPGSTAIGIDFDPVTLRLANSSAEVYEGRFRVVESDLSRPGWVEVAGIQRGTVDVVASSTALHWIRGTSFDQLMVSTHSILRPGGVFLDADNLAFSSALPTVSAITAAIQESAETNALANGAMSWDDWWTAISSEPEFAELCSERIRRFPPGETFPPPLLSDYLSALDRAGFAEIETVWQYLDDRVLLALKGNHENQNSSH